MNENGQKIRETRKKAIRTHDIGTTIDLKNNV